MRNPPDDDAGRPAGWRRGHHGRRSGGQRDASGAGSAGSAERRARTTGRGTDSSVFAPGYGDLRARDQERVSDGHGTPSGWYGSTASGSAGRGPVRGYAPAPGQPLPLYPPGQFAAWNRGARGDRSATSQPPGRPGANWQAAPPAVDEAERADTGYYRQDTEPGYSELAVRDPAADVTSTRTWQAAGEGRATGTWVMPDRMPAEPEAGDVPQPGRGERENQRRLAPWSPQAASPLPVRRPREQDAGDPRRLAGPSMPTARPAVVPGGPGEARPGGRASRRPASSGAPPGQPRPPASRKRKRKYPRTGYLGAALLVLAAGAALYFAARYFSSSSHPPPVANGNVPSAAPAATPTPTLGPYGHIASRRADAQPLTVAQLYPARFTASGAGYVRAAAQLGRKCVHAVAGSDLQSAVSKAGCTQAVRASYLAGSTKVMGTIGVLNLKTAAAALKAAHAAGPSNFVAQLRGRHGPTRRLGRGTGVEEYLVKGHYLILIWAEFTDLQRPKTHAQRARLGNFMTQVLRHTANVSLSNRMATGSP